MPTKVTLYRCDVCGSKFDSEQAALQCEEAPVIGDDFRVGDELVRGTRDVFRVVHRHLRRMAKVNGEGYHLVLYKIEGPYTWQGKPRLTSAKDLRRRGLVLSSIVRA